MSATVPVDEGLRAALLRVIDRLIEDMDLAALTSAALAFLGMRDQLLRRHLEQLAATIPQHEPARGRIALAVRIAHATLQLDDVGAVALAKHVRDLLVACADRPPAQEGDETLVPGPVELS